MVTVGVNVLYEDHLGVVDFHPSERMGVVYVSEGDLVAGTSYKRKLAKLRMVGATDKSIQRCLLLRFIITIQLKMISSI